MEDKNILPRLSRKMLESSFFSFLLLSVVLSPLPLFVFSDDVLLFVLVLAGAAIVENRNRGCKRHATEVERPS